MGEMPHIQSPNGTLRRLNGTRQSSEACFEDAPPMPHAQPGGVQILPADPSWPDQARTVVAELQAVIPAALGRFEHIGSTAVPGLCAKPVLDLLWGLPALDAASASAEALRALGFAYRPAYETEVPDRRYFVRPEDPGLRVHLHGVVVGGTLWREHLAFRDALRRQAALAQAYGELKQALAQRHTQDKAAYTAAKAPFIRRVLGCCGA